MKPKRKLPKQSAPQKNQSRSRDETSLSALFPRLYQVLLLFSAAVILISQQFTVTARSLVVASEFPMLRVSYESHEERCAQLLDRLRPVGALTGARVPVYPDAVLSHTTPSFTHVEYVTDAPAGTVRSFYSRLLALGCWTPGASAVSELRFTQANRTLSITLSADTFGRSVIAYDLATPRVAGTVTTREAE